MSDADELVELGMVVNDAGDSVAVGLQGGKVHLEVANTGREPVEVWLSAADALGLAELLHRDHLLTAALPRADTPNGGPLDRAERRGRGHSTREDVR